MYCIDQQYSDTFDIVKGMQFISNLKSLLALNMKTLSRIFVVGGLQVAAFVNMTRSYFKLWLERDDEIFKACEDADSLASFKSILSRLLPIQYLGSSHQ